MWRKEEKNLEFPLAAPLMSRAYCTGQGSNKVQGMQPYSQQLMPWLGPLTHMAAASRHLRQHYQSCKNWGLCSFYFQLLHFLSPQP